MIRRYFETELPYEVAQNYFTFVSNLGQLITRYEKDELVLFCDYWRLRDLSQLKEYPWPLDIRTGPILYVNTAWVHPSWYGKLHFWCVGELLHRNPDAQKIVWHNTKRHNSRLFEREIHGYSRTKQFRVVD